MGQGAAVAFAVGVLAGIGAGFVAGRAWERYAYEMAAARVRLVVARGYAGAAFRAVGGLVVLAAAVGVGMWWAAG